MKTQYLFFYFVMLLAACKQKEPAAVNSSGDLLFAQVQQRPGSETPTAPVAEQNQFVFSGTNSDAAGTHTDLAFRRVNASGSVALAWLVGMPNTSNEAYHLQKTNSGGYLILGAISGLGKDAQLVFTDADGHYQSELVCGGSGDDAFSGAVQLGDGSYLICGTSNSSGAGLRDIYLVKMNSSGGKVWEKTFGTAGNDGAAAIIPFGDGYAIFGYTDGTGFGDRDLCLLKINASGDSLWMKTYGGSAYEQSGGMVATKDGNYVMCGHSTSFGDPMHDAYLVKVDVDGNKIWQQTYGDKEHDGADAIVELSNGDLACTSYSRIPDLTDNELYYLQVTPAGKLRRQMRYGYAQSNETGMGIAELADGIVIVGSTNRYGNPDVYLVKIKK